MEVITRKQAREQGLKTYFTGKPCPRGQIAPRYTSTGACSCRACTDYRNSNSAEAKQRWYEENKEAHSARNKEWRMNNAERKKASDRAHYLANKEKVKARAAAWSLANPEKRAGSRRKWSANNQDAVRRLRNDFYHKNYGENPQYTLSVRLRTDMRTSFKSLAGGSGRVASAKLLGTSWAAAAEHLSSFFHEGMSWDNYGDWHVDHIRPCASFDQSDPKQQKVCWNWRNLQPLWASENISKSDNWTPAMEAEWVQRMTELGWEGELFLVFDETAAA